MLSPRDVEQHETLNADVTAYLQMLGFVTCDLTYHENAPPPFSRILKHLFSVPALVVRTRADRLATNGQTVLAYELKTNQSGVDIFVEALPLFQHHTEWRTFGVPCLYAHRWPSGPGAEQPDVGFWIDDEIIRAIDAVFLFDRPRQACANGWVERHAQSLGLDVRYSGSRAGSGDPSLRIPLDAGRPFEHWSTLLNRHANNGVAATNERLDENA